jgi:outer membrane lipoprotein SlyB
VLGVSVVALGTTLVVQNAGPSAGALPAQASTVQPALTTGGPDKNQPGMPLALAGIGNVAMNNGASGPGATRVQTEPGPAPQPYQLLEPLRTAAAPAPAPGPAPRCASCGRVESVQAVQQAAPASGVGAVAGGVLGAVVGNQVGKGSGRAAATVLGAVGGGYVGHKVEQRTRTQTVYQIAVRMEDGSVRRFTRTQPPAVGTPVVLQGQGFRVDDGAQRLDGPAVRAPAGAVRVADSY